MFKLDEEITRTYFRLEEAQRQRLWMERVWHPELMKWAKAPPPLTEVKRIRQEELRALGFGEAHYDRMLEAEIKAKAELETLAQLHPLWYHFRRLNGFGPYLCGAFIAAGGDISRPPTGSAFWYGMGLDLNPDGTVPRRIRGDKQVERKIPALPHVTRVGEQIRQQFVRSGGKLYTDFYLPFREAADARHPDRAKIFNFKDALRRTQKVLYACAWREWRLAYGLPAPELYAFDILKHRDGSLIRFFDLYDREPVSTELKEEAKAIKVSGG